MRVTVLAAAAMFGAAALWGVAGGVVSGLGVSGAAAASAVELTTGIALTLIAWGRGHRPSAIVAALRWRLAMLGLAEAVNVLLYYEALQLAPVGPAMALHLTAPVWLTLIEFARGRRRITGRPALALVAMCVALVLIATGSTGLDRYPQAALGLALSLASAGCLAVFLALVGNAAADVPPMSAAGAQMFVSGLLLTPALVDVGRHAAEVPTLAGLSVLVFAPACWLYWLAMRRLRPITAGTILLVEPFFGMITALVVYASSPSVTQVVAMVLVLGAVYLDLGTNSRNMTESQV